MTIHEEITEPKMATVVSSNTKWLLERRRSKAYGAKSTLEVNLTADREVLDALQAAKARHQGKVELVQVEDVLDLELVNGVATAISSAVPSVSQPASVSAQGPSFDEAEHQRLLAEIS
jgi:hypothetical protein